MNQPPDEILPRQLRALNVRHGDYAADFVRLALAAAVTARASDLHFQPCAGDLELRWRLDGVLQSLGRYSRGEGTDVLTRLKVVAGLLTYRTDIPQEGRIAPGANNVEMRVATFPTLHGERIVVRLLAAAEPLRTLADLTLPADIEATLRKATHETSGALLLAGPAGSGKTTTIYALVREIASATTLRSIVSIEDPVECEIEGVAQANVRDRGEFDFASGLRALVRQDPEVIVVGEIRDQATAEIVLQASLTGHLVFSSLHAGRAADGIARLVDWRIDSYALQAGLMGVMCQRLVRKLCECRLERGCSNCLHTRYRGRTVIAELMSRLDGTRPDLRTATNDATAIDQAARGLGMKSLAARASDLLSMETVDEAEIHRVLGLSWREGD